LSSPTAYISITRATIRPGQKYSVMTTTVAEAIKYAIANGLNTVNLSPGADVSKTRWGPRVEEHPVVYEYSRRLTSRVAAKVYVAAKYGNGFPSWLRSVCHPRAAAGIERGAQPRAASRGRLGRGA